MRDRLVVRDVRADEDDQVGSDPVRVRAGRGGDAERLLEPERRRRVAHAGGVVDRVRADRPRRLLRRVVRLVRHPARGQVEAGPLGPGVADAPGRHVERLVPADALEAGLARAPEHRMRDAAEPAELVAAHPLERGDVRRARIVQRAHRVQAEQAQPDVAEMDAVECPVAEAPWSRARTRRRRRRRGSASRMRPGPGSPTRRGRPRRSCSGRCSPTPNGLSDAQLEGVGHFTGFRSPSPSAIASIFAVCPARAPRPTPRASPGSSATASRTSSRSRIRSRSASTASRSPSRCGRPATTRSWRWDSSTARASSTPRSKPGLTDDLAGNVVEVAGPLLRDPGVRSFYTTSSCGVCGKGAIEQVEVLSAPLPPGPEIERDTLASLPERLRQPGFDRTGGLHATGLFDPVGRGGCACGRTSAGTTRWTR